MPKGDTGPGRARWIEQFDYFCEGSPHPPHDRRAASPNRERFDGDGALAPIHAAALDNDTLWGATRVHRSTLLARPRLSSGAFVVPGKNLGAQSPDLRGGSTQNLWQASPNFARAAADTGALRRRLLRAALQMLAFNVLNTLDTNAFRSDCFQRPGYPKSGALCTGNALASAAERPGGHPASISPRRPTPTRRFSGAARILTAHCHGDDLRHQLPAPPPAITHDIGELDAPCSMGDPSRPELTASGCRGRSKRRTDSPTAAVSRPASTNSQLEHGVDRLRRRADTARRRRPAFNNGLWYAPASPVAHRTGGSFCSSPGARTVLNPYIASAIAGAVIAAADLRYEDPAPDHDHWTGSDPSGAPAPIAEVGAAIGPAGCPSAISRTATCSDLLPVPGTGARLVRRTPPRGRGCSGEFALRCLFRGRAVGSPARPSP